MNDWHYAFTMLHKARKDKNKMVQNFAERLYALQHDIFAQVDESLVESQLVGFFIDGFHNDFSCMKVMRENPKTFQASVQSALAEQNLRDDLTCKHMTTKNPVTRSEKEWRLVILDHKENVLCVIRVGM